MNLILMLSILYSYGKKSDKNKLIDNLNTIFIQSIVSKDITPLESFWLTDKEQKKLSLKIEKKDSVCYYSSNSKNYNLTDLKNNLQYQINELQPINITFERNKDLDGCAGIKYYHSLYNIENKEINKTNTLQIITYFKKKKIRLLYYFIS